MSHRVVVLVVAFAFFAISGYGQCPSSPPTLQLPTDGAQNVSVTPTFQWSTTGVGSTYDVYLGFAGAGCTAGPVATTSTSSFNPPQLQYNTNYEWKIVAKPGGACPNLTSTCSSFKTTAACPNSEATLVSPVNTIVDQTQPVTFVWNAVAQAVSYDILIAAGTSNTFIALASGLGGSPYSTTMLTPGSYKWAVKTNFAGGCSPVISHSTQFVVGTPVACPTSAPIPLAPANNATSVTSPVTFDWNDVPNATNYKLLVSFNGGSFAPLAATTASEYTATLSAGSYEWFVETTNASCSEMISTKFKFTVVTPPTCAAPLLLSPANNATGVTSPVSYQWHPASGAVAYKLYVASGTNAPELVAVTTQTSVSRFAPDGPVTWSVAAVYNNGCSDQLSQPFKFTAGAATCPTGSIALTAPANGATVSGDNKVTFNWTGISGAASYRLWLAADGGTPSPLARTSDTTVQLSLPSGSAEWFVEATFNSTSTGNACPSIFSAKSKFTIAKSANCDTHKAVTLVSPAGGSQQSPIDFTWTATDNSALLYRLWLSVNNEPFVDVALTKDTHYKADVPAGTATWYVESFFSGCPSLTSARATFTATSATARCSDGAPSNLSPSDNATTSAPVTLTWSAVTNAVEYRIFAARGTGDFVLIDKTTDTTLSKDLPPGTYSWYVSAAFPGCPAADSAKTKFTVAQASNCTGAVAPQLTAPADDATGLEPLVTFSWNSVSGAVGYFLFAKKDDGSATKIGETTGTSITARMPEGAIEWFVLAFFNGCNPAESAHFGFEVRSTGCDNRAPQLHTPDDGAVVFSPVHATWSSVPRATQYKVWASVDGGAMTVIGTTTDNKLTIPAPAGRIRWFVEALFTNCPSSVSSLGSFVVRNAPACAVPAKPVATVVGAAASGAPYSVRWSDVANVSSYELQESTTADFSTATTTNSTETSATFTHTATDKAVRYFYRVRGVSSCSDDRGPYSTPVAIFVLPPKPPSANQRQTSAEIGVQTAVTQTIALPGQNPPTTFSVTSDRPWVTITPSSGTIGPDGVTLTVASDPTVLAIGTNTATIKVTYGASAKAANAISTVSVPVSVSLVTPVSSTGKNTPPPDSLIVPAVGHAQGANDSLFESDVRVANLSATLQKYTLNFTLSNTDGTQSGQSTTIQIDPGKTMALDDILTSFFGVGNDGSSATGVLEIRPQTSTTSSFSTTSSVSVQTVASSKTYNQTSTGTFGQFIPAVPFSQFIGKSVSDQAKTLLSLQQIAQSQAYRTNFGLVEAAGEPAEVLVHIFDNAGSELAQIPISLKAGEHKQFNNFLAANNVTVADGRIEVEVTSTTGKVTAYASVVDNVTNDPLLVSPVLKGSGADQKFAIPGMADLNNGFASWRSDIRLFNAGSAPAPVTLTYYPGGNAPGPAPLNLTINAGEVRAIDNALQTLFGLTNSGGQMIVTTPAATNLVVTARTYNQTATGTYGQFIPGVTPAQSAAAGKSLQLLQLETSDRFRTNIGVSETTGQPVSVDVTVIPSDSKITAKISMDLLPYEFRQFSLNDFGLGTLYNARVTVKATSGAGRVTAYGSVIDQITQDPTYVPAQ